MTIRPSVAAWSVLAALTLSGCESPRPPVAPPMLDEAAPGGDPGAPGDPDPVCIEGGDFSYGATWLIDCSQVAAGFPAFTIIPVELAVSTRQGLQGGPRPVYFVVGAVWTPGGTGYSLVAATNPGVVEGGPGGTTYNAILEMNIRVFWEMDGFSLHGYIGGCPDSPEYDSPVDCARHAFANGAHYEPGLCVWNSASTTTSSAMEFCHELPYRPLDQGPPLPANQLPTSAFQVVSVEQVYCGPNCPPLLRWTLDASSSTDPEGGALTYLWRILGYPYTTQSPTFEVETFNEAFVCAGTCYGVVLRVTDPLGGVDANGMPTGGW